MKSADILIIGGGVMGASVAYHLALHGCKNIVVVDRGQQPGEGSTGKATGGFRTQFSTEINVRLSLLARSKLLHFSDELGVDPGYRQCGYLFIARHERELSSLRAGREVQRAAGVQEVQDVSIDDIQRLNPAVSLDGVVGGSFCPIDGFIRPMNILRGYIEGAKRLGVRFEHNIVCVGMKREWDRILEVSTLTGTYAVGIVINAAGAWADVIARQAGIEIPVQPLKRQVAATVTTNILPEEMPMTIFTDDGFHLRVRDGRVLLLKPVEFDVDDPFDAAFDTSWLSGVITRAHERVPCLWNVEIDAAHCWAGLYEMSPDKHAILGRAPEVRNFYLMNGSSGHGVMHAPALGHLLAEVILDGSATTINVNALRPERFAQGELNAVSDVL